MAKEQERAELHRIIRKIDKVLDVVLMVRTLNLMF